MRVKIGCHTFRATGITAYLEAGGTLENAQAMAAHESPRTTKLYDRPAMRSRSMRWSGLRSEGSNWQGNRYDPFLNHKRSLMYTVSELVGVSKNNGRGLVVYLTTSHGRQTQVARLSSEC